MTLARRMQLIQPFHVMALLARARELEATGRSIMNDRAERGIFILHHQRQAACHDFACVRSATAPGQRP